jgi:hypothetical protein
MPDEQILVNPISEECFMQVLRRSGTPKEQLYAHRIQPVGVAAAEFDDHASRAVDALSDRPGVYHSTCI